MRSLRNIIIVRILFLIIFCFKFIVVNADEGMWIPMLLAKYNEADMQSKGLKLSADDIYSVNHTSLKDAVVQFGGGCTAELISGEGLILTNHHCGYSRVQAHSTLENNYLENGFWAMNMAEELSNPGLTVSFLVRMEEVTAAVLKGVLPEMSEAVRSSVIEKNARELEKKSISGTHYEARVKDFFNGNEYYIFITEIFKDVRLVGAPPSSIGKFGGDTDNWMWPRHTGDFSIFRIYADSLNNPAEYSPKNKPYIPKKYFEISLKELNEGDFTMVFGFPGRTQEYLTSYAVKQLVEEEDPLKISIREKRLSIIEKAMESNPQVKLDFSAKYAGISNYYKKFLGESRGLKRMDATGIKQKQEIDFSDWVNLEENRKAKFGNLFSEMDETYKLFSGYNKGVVLFNEAFNSMEFVKYVNSFVQFSEQINKGLKKDEIIKETDKLSKLATSFLKSYYGEIDREISNQLLPIYIAGIYGKDSCLVLGDKFKCNINLYLDAIFSKSILFNESKVLTFINSLNKDAQRANSGENIDASTWLKKLEKDIAFSFVQSSVDYFRTNISPGYLAINNKLDSLNRIYMQAQREMQPDKKFYPNANLTLRLTYGKVNSYSPVDGVLNTPFTTIDGIIEKENPNDKEFIVPAKLKELYERKDYGQYAVNGTVPVCFLASNHTTGGNSGSPVLNSEGQLIGTNFDRNWEGTAADIMYDPSQARNISLDIRYTLFIIDKFAGAKYLLDEMTIVK